MIDTVAIKTEPGTSQNVHQICRLCLSEECLDDIFKEEGLQRWIMEFLSITILTSDPMSKNICTICRIRLTEFHQFRLRCQDVQNVLQSMCQNNYTGRESESDHSTPVEHGCKDCGTLFAVRENLDNHTNIHTKLMHNDEQDLLVKLREVKTELFDNADVTKSKVALENQLQENQSNVESVSVDSPPTNNEEAETNQSMGTEDMIDIQGVKIEARTDDGVNLGNGLINESSHSLVDDRQTSQIKQVIDKVASLQCKICLKFYETRTDILRHHKFVHGPRNHKCIPCKQAFCVQNELRRHLLTKKHLKKMQQNESINLPTDVVDEDQSNRNADKRTTTDHVSLQYNVRYRRPAKPVLIGDDAERPYECDICQKKFKFRKQIYSHRFKVHGAKVYPCQICDTTFRAREHLQRHILRHNSGDQEDYLMILQLNNDTNKAKASDTQQRKDSIIDDLSKEKDKPDDNKERNCDVNHKSSENESLHSTKNICRICEKPFISWLVLKRHMLAHEPNRLREPEKSAQIGDDVQLPYECDICHKKFKLKDTLYGHKHTVHGPKIHGCDMCDNKYSTRDRLLMHMRTHTRKNQKKILMSQQVTTSETPESVEPKSFKCMKCEKVFPNQNRLWVHCKRGHRRRYPCSSCDAVLITKKLLTTHMATKHIPKIDSKSSSKIFSCTLCSRWFPTNNHLAIHVKAHAPPEYNCKLCSKKYSARQWLFKHMHNAHGETLKFNKRDRSSKGSISDSDKHSEFFDTENTSKVEQSEQSTEKVTPRREQPRRGTHEQTRSKIRAAYED